MSISMSTLRNFKLNELSALSMCDGAIAESTMFLLGIWDVIQTAAYDFGMSFVLVRRLSFVMFQPIALHLTTCPQAPLDSTDSTTLRHSIASLHRPRHPFSRSPIVHDVLAVLHPWRESVSTSMSPLQDFKLNELRVQMILNQYESSDVNAKP